MFDETSIPEPHPPQLYLLRPVLIAADTTCPTALTGFPMSAAFDQLAPALMPLDQPPHANAVSISYVSRDETDLDQLASLACQLGCTSSSYLI